MKFLLTVVLWFPGTPEPQVAQVVDVAFVTYNECEATREDWEYVTMQMVHEEFPDLKKEEVLFSYCSGGKSAGPRDQSSMF